MHFSVTVITKYEPTDEYMWDILKPFRETDDHTGKYDSWCIGGRCSGLYDGKNSITLKELKLLKNTKAVVETFAILTPDNNWIEPGLIDKFWEIIDMFNEQYYVTVVDCHI